MSNRHVCRASDQLLHLNHCVEPLEKRVLLAAITGVVFNDANNTRVRETGEEALSGWTVYLDQNKNRRRDPGEVSTTTNQHGAYAFENLAPGDYYVGIEMPPGWGQTSPGGGGLKRSDFNIEVRFVDRNMTESQKDAFRQAAARWEQIIIGDLPDVFDEELGWIDDIVIDASAPFIDDVGFILGQANFTHQRPAVFDDLGFAIPGSRLPYRGFMEFDKADIQQLEADGELYAVILHEMAHVLGFSGRMWQQFGIVSDEEFFPLLRVGQNPIYVGRAALAEYNAMFNLRDIGIAVEDLGGGGTALAHWRERVLDNELMTGALNSGVNNPISRVTVAQFADLGYQVNMGAADHYVPPGAGVVRRTPSPNDPRFGEPLDVEPFVASRVQLASPPRNLVPYTHTVTIASADEVIRERDFGVRENAPPQIRVLSDRPDPAPQGALITLDAKGVHDPDGRVMAVTFYRESNGVPGLQTGVGGDTYISTKIPEQGFRAQTSTSGLLPGTYRYYARAIDNLGHTTTVSTVNTVIGPQTVPAKPVDVRVTEQTHNSITIEWTDRSDNELGFFLQRSTDPHFAFNVESWRLDADTTSFTDTKLPSTSEFYYRVRSFNTAGSSDYARTVGGTFTLSPGDIIIDNRAPVGRPPGAGSASVVGNWTEIEHPQAFGGSLLIDNRSGKGEKSVTFTPNIPVAGNYIVYARWIPTSNRATNVPIEITGGRRPTTVTVNQRDRGADGAWVQLGTFNLPRGTGSSVIVRNDGTQGVVVADAVRFQATFPVTQAQRNAAESQFAPLSVAAKVEQRDPLDLADKDLV